MSAQATAVQAAALQAKIIESPSTAVKQGEEAPAAQPPRRSVSAEKKPRASKKKEAAGAEAAQGDALNAVKEESPAEEEISVKQEEGGEAEAVVQGEGLAVEAATRSEQAEEAAAAAPKKSSKRKMAAEPAQPADKKGGRKKAAQEAGEGGGEPAAGEEPVAGEEPAAGEELAPSGLGKKVRAPRRAREVAAESSKPAPEKKARGSRKKASGAGTEADEAASPAIDPSLASVLNQNKIRGSIRAAMPGRKIAASVLPAVAQTLVLDPVSRAIEGLKPSGRKTLFARDLIP